MTHIIKVKNYQDMINHYGQTNGSKSDTYQSRKRVREESLSGEIENFELAPKRLKVDEYDSPRTILKVESIKYQNMLSWWSLDTKNYFIREHLVREALKTFENNKFTEFNDGIFYRFNEDKDRSEYMLYQKISKIYIHDINCEDWSKIIYSSGEVLGKLHSKLWNDIEDNLPLNNTPHIKELNSFELDDVFNFYAKTLRDMNYTGYIFPGLDNLRYQFRLLYDELKLSDDPKVLVHGNFTTSNILIDNKRKTVKSIIGWGEAGIGSPLADWVNIHLSFIDYGLNDPIIMDWFLKGYQKNCHPSIIPLIQNYKKILGLWSRLMAYAMETINLWIYDNNYPERQIKYSKWLEII
uniref:Aminoglycoside phosphotransferase domain-containing protein n=1 Tax=viral metagenome TaxID=1070528 RepID=A0A6C0E7A0_9ZZZZ